MMQYELWFVGESAHKVDREAGGRIYAGMNARILSAPPDIQSKSGYHLVAKSDPPKPSAPAVPVVSQDLPTTLRGIRSQNWQTGIGRLGKAVGQLLVSGYVDYARSPILLQHLAELAQAYDTLHREIRNIPVDALGRADEAIAEKK